MITTRMNTAALTLAALLTEAGLVETEGRSKVQLLDLEALAKLAGRPVSQAGLTPKI